MKESLEHLPIGFNAELQKEVKTLPAVEVKNEVFWVNPAFEDSLPFALEPGESAKLGLFLTEERTPDEKEPTKKIEVMTGHKRSGIIGRAIFKDRDGNLYRDIDLKGLGRSDFPTRRPRVKPVKPRPALGYAGPLTQAEGLLSLVDALASKDMEEKFTELGIRTSRTVAIMLLEEIPDAQDGKISIAEAKQRGQIPETLVPALAVRAFRTKYRMVDLNNSLSEDVRRLSEDARLLVAAEFDFDPEEFNKEAYLEWFAKNLGENLAKMHRADYYHRNLSGHNITLDCRIVDLDSVRTFEEGRELIREEMRKNGKKGEPPSIAELMADEFLLAKKELQSLFFQLYLLSVAEKAAGTGKEKQKKDPISGGDYLMDLLKKAYDETIAKPE